MTCADIARIEMWGEHVGWSRVATKNNKNPKAGNDKSSSVNSKQSHWSLSYGKLRAVSRDKDRKIG